jgi:hypothetical protein
MLRYKRNQVEEAIFRTLGAREEARVDELKLRLKRLLVTDRRLELDAKSDDEDDRHYAFYSGAPPGSGIEVMFSAYEAFALLAAILLLEHGLPQERVVNVMRQVRRKFEAAHTEILKKDPSTLFDQQAIMAKARPGMMATDNTDPVFLVFARLTGSSVAHQKGSFPVAICRSDAEVGAFMKKHAPPGMGITVFEYVRWMHALAANLSLTRPVKRGRGAA